MGVSPGSILTISKEKILGNRHDQQLSMSPDFAELLPIRVDYTGLDAPTA